MLFLILQELRHSLMDQNAFVVSGFMSLCTFRFGSLLSLIMWYNSSNAKLTFEIQKKQTNSSWGQGKKGESKSKPHSSVSHYISHVLHLPLSFAFFCICFLTFSIIKRINRKCKSEILSSSQYNMWFIDLHISLLVTCLSLADLGYKSRSIVTRFLPRDWKQFRKCKRRWYLFFYYSYVSR